MQDNKSQGLTAVKAVVRFMWHIVGGWEDLVGLGLLFAMLTVAVGNVQGADWISPQPSLITVLVLAMLLALIMVRSRLDLGTTVLIAVLTGIIVTVWQATNVVTVPETSSPLQHLNEAFSSLWQSIGTSAPNQGTIYFALFLTVMSWVLGYVLAWLLLRRRSVWPAVFLGFIVLLVNLDYLSKSSYGYFYLYLLCAVLFVGFVSFIKQQSVLRLSHNNIPGRVVLWFGVGVVILGVVLVGVIWAAPEINANQLQTLTDSKVRLTKTLDNLKINFFAPVKAKGAIIKSTDQGTLYFSTPPDLSTDVQFNVVATQAPSYWRVRRYDIYNSFGWSISPYTDSILGSGIALKASGSAAAPAVQTYAVIDKLKTDIVLVAGRFLSSNSPVLVHTANWGSAGADPNDVITSVTEPRIYKPDESYSVTVNVSTPSVAQLSGAGGQYPQSISAQYLQLPSNLPQNVRRISQNIVRGAPTPYNKVIAVRNYLQQFNYDVGGSSPSQGADEVESFLTVQKSGNCTNFATAAVVLLRSAGVPARLCTGYIPHLWNKDSGTFIVEARDYHAWPEVYFPGYGWVEFEVTPNSTPSITSSTDNAQNGSGSNSSSDNTFAIGGPSSDQPQPSESPAVLPAANSGLSFSPVIWVAIILGMLLIVWILISSWYSKKFGRKDYAVETWGKLCYFSSWLRLSPRPQQTAEEYGNYLTQVFPEQKQSINRLTQAFVNTRFSAHKDLAETEKELIRRSWRSMFWAIVRRRVTRV